MDESENLLPASLADRQLDHLERMVRTVGQNNLAGPVHGMDLEYWENRIRALVEGNNLVAVQQLRVKRLLRDLESRTKSRSEEMLPEPRQRPSALPVTSSA